MKQLIFLFFLFLNTLLHAAHAITYEGGDRLGDRLLAYSQARYLTYITQVPFLHRPFRYSDQMKIDYQAESYEEKFRSFHFQYTIRSGDELLEFFRRIQNPNTPPTLFILDYHPTEITEWDKDSSRSVLFNVPWWQDREFFNYLHASTAPNIPIPDLTVEGRLNVAAHVRTLSGGDTVDTSTLAFPLKHTNTDYHKRQIRRVYEYNRRRPMHVFLFSDTKEPLALLEEFRNSFRGEDIIFNTRVLEQPDTQHAVEDFFAMQKFNVLIATQSNFSMMAARVGDYDMVIFPIRAIGVHPNSHIDRVQLVTRKSSWFPYQLDITLKDMR
ncbi:MAG TPA: hypothetical protein VLE89_04265 [Chlamydiales bacterium]|nr:hypothetical protein [Chlamydiales bacterium]